MIRRQQSLYGRVISAIIGADSLSHSGGSICLAMGAKIPSDVVLPKPRYVQIAVLPSDTAKQIGFAVAQLRREGYSVVVEKGQLTVSREPDQALADNTQISQFGQVAVTAGTP